MRRNRLGFLFISLPALGSTVIIVALKNRRDYTPRWARDIEIRIVERLECFIQQKVNSLIMALVQVDQDVIDTLTDELSGIGDALDAEIQSLKTALPDADLSGLTAVKDRLAGLEVPTPAPDAPTA